MLFGLAALAGLAGSLWASGPKQTQKTKQTPKSAARSAPDGTEPFITLSGVRLNVYKAAALQQRVDARWCRVDEGNQVLNLKDVSLGFFQDDQARGDLRCGQGTLWLEDRPAEGIGQHDMLLEDDVVYRTDQGWQVNTPRMRYNGAAATLTSTDGFTKRVPSGDRWIRSSGSRVEIRFQPGTSTVERWTEQGEPLVMEPEKADAKP